MKSNSILTAADNLKGLLKKIVPPVITITTAIIFMAPIVFNAQNNSTTVKSVSTTIGIKPSIILTGSGLGASYSLQAFHQKGDYMIFAGPMIQFRKNNLSGIHAGMQYTLTGKGKNRQN